MFWASVLAGLQLLGQWEVWVAVGVYVLGTFVYLMIVGIVMGGEDSGGRFGVGCVFHAVAGPFVEGMMMAVMMAFLLPVILSGGREGGLPLSGLAQLWWPVVGSGVIATVAVFVLCFLPLVGGIISKSVGIQAFILGVIILRLLAGHEIESSAGAAGVSGSFYPGLWASVGFLAIGAVLVWALMMGTSALVVLAGGRDKAEGLLQVAGLATGPALAVLGGVIPLLMYGSHIRLAVEHQQSRPALVQATEEPAPLTTDESDRYSRVMAKLDKQPLGDEDLSELRAVFDSYTKRTGNWITREQYDATFGVMKTMVDYQYELGQSLLVSWDRRERFTTSRFASLAQAVDRLDLRTPEVLARDEACLQAAAANQRYVEDEDGSMYEFGRDVILQKMRENDLSRANWEKVKELMEEFVR